MNETDKQEVYTMAQVRSMTGLSDRQIRYYQKKGWVQGTRTAGNQRLFDREAIGTLIFIRDWLQKGQRALGLEEALEERRQKASSSKGDLAHRLNQIAHEQEMSYSNTPFEWRG